MIFEVFLIFFALGYLTYRYGARNHGFWRSKGIGGPKPLPFIGTLWENFTIPTTKLELQRYLKYGRIYGTYEGNKPVVTIGEPRLLKHILVRDFHLFIDRRPTRTTDSVMSKFLLSLTGEDWKRVRAISSPTFSSGKIRRMFKVMDKCTDGAVRNFGRHTSDTEGADLKKIYGALTMDVIARCAFGTITNAHDDPSDPFVVNVIRFLTFPLWRFAMFLLLPSFVLKLLGMKQLVQPEAVSFFKSAARHLLTERRSKKKDSKDTVDFLQLLVNSERRSDNDMIDDIKDISGASIVNETEDELKNNASLLSSVQLDDGNRKLSENEILAQTILFFVAGYDTTGSALTYATYALALNPDIQEKLYEELQNAFGDGSSIDFDTLNHLPYLDAVINESLRMYPPALRFERLSASDYLLETGLLIPKGTLVSIPVYAIQHDPEFYKDPEVFNPDRFLDNNRQDILPFTFLPFGAGPRNCIGMRFALVEAKLALTKVLLQYRFKRIPRTHVPLQFKAISSLLSVTEARVGVEQRL